MDTNIFALGTREKHCAFTARKGTGGQFCSSSLPCDGARGEGGLQGQRWVFSCSAQKKQRSSPAKAPAASEHELIGRNQHELTQDGTFAGLLTTYPHNNPVGSALMRYPHNQHEEMDAEKVMDLPTASPLG